MLGLLWPALLTGLATTLGALPFLLVPSVPRRAYDALLGLGAGLMLAAATLGLLTTALHAVRVAGDIDYTRLVLVVGGFAAGVALLSAMDWAIPHVHAGGHLGHVHADHVHERSTGAAACAAGPEPEGPEHRDERAWDHRARRRGLLVVGVMSLHRVPEGLAIGAAWAAGASALAPMLVVAVAVQNAVEGGVMAAPLRRGGLGAPKLLALITATGMTVPLAALAGYAFSAHVAGGLPPTLALAAGALIYVTCNEVIPESHSHGNEVRATFGVLAGFVLVMLIQLLFGHAD
jgi:ZIP family zinc transporter